MSVDEDDTLITILTRWIQSININTQIDRFLRADPLLDLPNDAVHANGVDLTCLDNFETAIAVILIVTWTGQRGTDTDMDVAVVCQQAVLRRMIKVCAMVDACLLARCTAEDLWAPSVALFSQSGILRVALIACTYR